MILAKYKCVTLVATVTNIQPMRNGKQVISAIRRRPNVSINGPTMMAPTGRKIVTKLASERFDSEFSLIVRSEHYAMILTNPRGFIFIDLNGTVTFGELGQ